MADRVPQTGERSGLARNDLYRQPPRASRLGRSLSGLLARRGTRDEQALDARLTAIDPALTGAVRVAFVSPKGGVGKTTCTLLAGDLLSRYARLRCVAVDANPDYGTLGSLAPDQRRSSRSLADLLDSAPGELDSPAALRPFVSVLESGLHLLAAPSQARAMAELSAEHYDRLLDLLAGFYELILLDLGTGLTDPIARLALTRADVVVVVCTPEWITADRVLEALRDLDGTVSAGRTMVVLNQAPTRSGLDRQVLDAALHRAGVEHVVAIPFDTRLRALLDAGIYSPDLLPAQTRVQVKGLGLVIAGLIT